MGELFVGTSGWSYPEWRGTFYPEKFPANRMLAYYADRFRTVEMNNSFYRMPSPAALAGWRDAVPASFRFAFKAPQEITHRKRLVDAEAATSHLAEVLGVMGDRCGPVLFQLPPYFRADLGKLDVFLALARPLIAQVAFEFRHATWFTEEVYELLRKHDAALCLTETDTQRQPLVPAQTFAYLRLRKTEYSEDDLRNWKRELEAIVAGGQDVYCFFKHEGQFTGAALRLQEM